MSPPLLVSETVTDKSVKGGHARFPIAPTPNPAGYPASSFPTIGHRFRSGRWDVRENKGRLSFNSPETFL